MTDADPVNVRLADPSRDAAAVAAIYADGVERTVASFEEVAPTAAKMAERMRRILERTPWLVACGPDGRVVGYAYAGPHHARPGYRWSVNLSAYVADGQRGRGIGRRLYAELLDLLRRQGFVNAYAGVTLPNPASERLHQAIGMQRFAVYRRVGYKFGAWHDVAWYELRLASPPGRPAEPVALPDLAGGPMDAARGSA
jgi:phosphinothricin acetyltransferase